MIINKGFFRLVIFISLLTLAIIGCTNLSNNDSDNKISPSPSNTSTPIQTSGLTSTPSPIPTSTPTNDYKGNWPGSYSYIGTWRSKSPVNPEITITINEMVSDWTSLNLGYFYSGTIESSFFSETKPISGSLEIESAINVVKKADGTQTIIIVAEDVNYENNHKLILVTQTEYNEDPNEIYCLVGIGYGEGFGYTQYFTGAKLYDVFERVID